MKLTRLKTTVMAGMLAASMVLPGMTAMAADSISVKKTVNAADGVTLPTTAISFTATKTTNADGNVTPTTAPESFTIATKVANTFTIGEQAEIVANIPDEIKNTPGVYTYAITEDALPEQVDGYGWTKTSGDTYYLHIIVDQNKDVNYYASRTNELRTVTIEGEEKTGFYDEEGKSTKTDLVYENKYTKNGGNDENVASLTITKAVDNDSTIPESTKYTFTLDFETNALNPDTQVTYTDAEGNEKTGYAYTKSETEGTFYVADGETIELLKGETASFAKIPAGTYVNVTEAYVTNLDKVKIDYTSNGTETKGTSKSATEADNLKLDSSENGKGMLIGENANSVTYTNTYKDVSVTGVATSVAPYVTLVVLAVAAVAAYMAMKSRVAR